MTLDTLTEQAGHAALRIDADIEDGVITRGQAALRRRKEHCASVLIDWLGYENGLTRQDVVLIGRRTTGEAVADFAADHNAAKIIGTRVWYTR